MPYLITFQQFSFLDSNDQFPILPGLPKFTSFFYCCSSTVVSVSPRHSPSPHPSLPPTLDLPTLALSMGPLYIFLGDPSSSLPIIPLFPPLWLLSVCSLFSCLWFYFSLLFILLIRFHLQVRSYGIYLFFHCLAHFTLHNALQVHPCCHKGQELLSFCCIEFHCVNVPQFFDPLIC